MRKKPDIVRAIFKINYNAATTSTTKPTTTTTAVP